MACRGQELGGRSSDGGMDEDLKESYQGEVSVVAQEAQCDREGNVCLACQRGKCDHGDSCPFSPKESVGEAETDGKCDKNTSEILRISPDDIKFLEEHGIFLEKVKKIRKRIEKMSSGAFETYKLGLLIYKCLQTMDIETGTASAVSRTSCTQVLSKPSYRF